MKYSLVLGLLLALSLALSSVGIVRWNAGAPYDTAHKGIETIEEVLQGNLAPFYRHYNGQPPLMDWMLAPLFLFFGVSATTLHIVGIVSGVAATLLFYVTGKALWSRGAGLYAALFGTTSHWFLLEVREGTHNIPLVPVILFVVWCGARVYRSTNVRTRYWAAVGGGLAAGLSAYIYSAGWIFSLFFACALPLAVIISWTRSSQRNVRVPLLLSCALMFLMFFPFAKFVMDDPQAVFGHADDEVRTREPGVLVGRMTANMVPTVGAFFYLPFQPFSQWENNGVVTLANVPMPFPVPLVSPVVALLLLSAVVLIVRRWRSKEPMALPLLMLFFLFLALVPNLAASGPQPHYRRAVCAMVPLFLLAGWAASHVDAYVRTRSLGWTRGWYAVLIVGLLWGPILYFAGTQSQWFSENYKTGHDRVAPYLFARVAAGQRVLLVGNGAHLKSFEFYALATPQAQKAFTLFDRLPDDTIPEDVLHAADVIVYVRPTCDSFVFHGFTSPLVLRSSWGVDGCVFDRPGVSSQLQSETVGLPSSGPLWPAFRHSTPPVEKHEPLHGPIYGI